MPAPNDNPNPDQTQSLFGGNQQQSENPQTQQPSGDPSSIDQQQTQQTLLGDKNPPGGQEQQKSDEPKTLDAATEYEKFTLPEGFEYDEGKVGEFTTLAREMNLTQDQAQRLIDLHVKHWLGFEDQVRLQGEEWRKQAMNDPDFGGQRFTQSLADAMRFMDVFGGDKLRDALNETGAGNHPEIFKAFARAGRILAEDQLVKGRWSDGKRGETFADLANSMYPDMKTGGNS